MPRLDPHPDAVEARRLAAKAGLVMFEKPVPAGTMFHVHRRLPDGRTTFLGKRGTPEGVRAFVARLARAH